MLLPSDRHTAADLAYWSEREIADRIHGERLAASERPGKAIAEMKCFAEAGPCYVAVSWGKDSVVVAHLLHLSGLSLPVVNVAQHGPQYDPYVTDVRDAFLSRFPETDYHEIVVEESDSGQSSTGRAPSLMTGIAEAKQRFGGRYIGGIRAEEGRGRRVRCARGLSFGSGCAPIGWWNPADVFGWLAYHDLPVHPAYAMTGGGRFDRDRLRVSIIGGAKGRGGFRGPWESEYYGDLIRRLESGRTGT